MTSNVFPESMDKVDYKQTDKALRTIDEYIRYMCERTTYAVSNVTKKAALAGSTASEYYTELDNLKKTVSSLSSTVNTWQGAITGCQNDILTMQKDIKDLQDKYDDLDERVKALEEKE